MLAPMGASSYSDIKDSLRLLYLEDPCPWLVGFSGGKQGPTCGPFTGSGTRVVSSERSAYPEICRIANSQTCKLTDDAPELEIGGTPVLET